MKKLGIFAILVLFAVITGCDDGGDDRYFSGSVTILGYFDADNNGVYDGTAIDINSNGIPDGVDTDGDRQIDGAWFNDYSVLELMSLGDVDTNGDGSVDGTAVDEDYDGIADGVDSDGDWHIDEEWSDDFSILDPVEGEIVDFAFNADQNATSTAARVGSALFSDTNLTRSGIDNNGFGYVLAAYPAAGATGAETALAQDSYFTITIKPENHRTVTVTELTFEVGKGGASDPRGYFIRSSLDNYASDLIEEQLPAGTATEPAARTVTLSGHKDLSFVTFRIYVYSPVPSSNSVDFRNMSSSGWVR